MQIDKIIPTISQQKLPRAQFAIAWHDGSTLLLPCGGHQILHQPRPTVTTITDLADAQSGRKAYRRAKARERHAQVEAGEG